MREDIAGEFQITDAQFDQLVLHCRGAAEPEVKPEPELDGDALKEAVRPGVGSVGRGVSKPDEAASGVAVSKQP